MLRKICVVTGTRAEYGLLYWLMKEIQDAPDLQLQLIVTGMHLSPEFGLTYKVIEQDGFEIDARVEMLLSSDTPVGIAKSIGLGVIGFAEALDRLKPDIMVVLGDRYEILAAVQAALVARLPVAHIAGGDTTEGAMDEAIRHSITKMAHLHFVTNEISAQRVRQMGENPECIFNYGDPGLDQIRCLKLLDRTELEQTLEIKLRRKNLLITFHPVTLEEDTAFKQFQQLLAALDLFCDEVGLIFTKPNSDTGGRVLIKMLDEYVKGKDNAAAYVSLGQLRYLSTMQEADVVVGNSSSGIYEAPSFKKPTVNIGDRQKGRLQTQSIINCNPKAEEIYLAIKKAFDMDCSQIVNPYGDGHTSRRIVQTLRNIDDYKKLLKKHFFEVK